LRYDKPHFLVHHIAILLFGLRVRDRFDKYGAVIFGIVSNGAEHIGNQRHNDLGVDTVSGIAQRTAWHFLIYGVSIIRYALAVVHAVNVHFITAVSAVQQLHQRVSVKPIIGITPNVAPYVLYIFKGF